MSSAASLILTQEMYVAYYGRPADPLGLEFWCKKFDETDDLDEALDTFGTSIEYEKYFGGLTNEQLIDNLYIQMFNHAADDAGMAFYLERLNSGEATLASIAKQIADGSVDTDRDALDNKIEVSNTFTDEVDSTGADYNDSHLDGARLLIAQVDETDESVEEGNENAIAAVGLLEGEVVLTEDTPTADFSSSANALTIILKGDDDETKFVVTGSAFDDTFQVEEYLSAKLTGGAGTDTVDFTDADGAYTINLGTGNFTADLDEDGLPDISGSLISIESVIGSELDDIINGGEGDDILAGGDGVDVLTGGGGDDTFKYEDQDDYAAEVVTGGVGTDTIDFSSNVVDLSTTSPDNLSVEQLSFSNIDDANSVTITLGDTKAGTSIGPESFKKIIGSDEVDTLILVDTNADAAMLGATALESIESVTTADDLVVGPDTLTDVFTLVHTGGGGGTITTTTPGTYDFSGTTFTDWTEIIGAGNDIAIGDPTTGVIIETLVLDQTQLDSLITAGDGAAFGANLDGLIAATLTKAEQRDTLLANSSLDLSEVNGVDILEIEFGIDGTIELDENQFDDDVIYIIGGGKGTLQVNSDGDNFLDIDGVFIDGITTLALDSISSSETLRVGDTAASGLTNVDNFTGIDGDLNLHIGAFAVGLTGSDFSDFGDIVFDAATGDVELDQTVLDNFDEWGIMDDATPVTALTFRLGAATLNLTGVTYTVTVTMVTVAGDDDTDETVTEGNGDNTDPDRVFTYNLGDGDDNFVGFDKTADAGVITVNGDAGDDVIVLGEVWEDNAKTLQTADGGDGDDSISAGDSTDTLTGGDGVDTFTIAMNEYILGVAVDDFGKIPVTATDNDVIALNVKVGTALSDTAFESIIGNRLPVLNFTDTTATTPASKTDGVIVGIALNGAAVGLTTSRLPVGLSDTTDALVFLGLLDNYAADLVDTNFVLFATGGSDTLIAFVVNDNGTSVNADTKIATSEITTVILADLTGITGVISMEDIVLV